MALDASDTLRLELIPSAPELALATLAEPIRLWFRDRFARPTPSQRQAWPAVAHGNHCLVAAPTGTGKTLAAFLPILGRLLDAAAGSVRCLYLSPLKALCNDLHANVERILEELEPFLSPAQQRPRLGLRTGDTSAATRRALLRAPPDVLLTTPESLAVLLTQTAGCRTLAGVTCVIVDEVHALAGTKRGADLSLSLERLQDLADRPFQRIGLSATCSPLAEAARFLVGVGRSCTICPVLENNFPQIAIEPLGHLPSGEDAHPQRFFSQLLDRLEPEIEAARTTLIFTNTRSLAERLNWALRRRFECWADAIAVHHSSLAAKRRRLVEQQMKLGLLRVVVSSTSLELGIDIGSVDQVVLIHSPGDVIRLLQRVGRAGHAPGRLRRGLILTGHASELLEAAVTGAAGRAGQLEPLHTLAHPLDVLCQQLLGLAATRAVQPDEAFALVRRAYPYRALPREDFDDCLAYLSGHDHRGRPWLPPRLHRTEAGYVPADQRTIRILRCNLGTILAEEPHTVRLPDKTLVGELEPTYADRLQPGDRFLLDGRCLEFRRLNGSTVEAEEVPGRPRVPRWLGGGWPLSAALAERLFVFRVRAGETLRRGPTALAALLEQEYQLSPSAAALLTVHFERQEAISEIPDACTCLIELVPSPHGVDYYFHTPLNRTGNEALARVAQHRLARMGQRAALPVVADLGFLLALETVREVDAEGWRVLLAADRFQEDVQQALADSPLLGERFRQVACTGLMLLRNPLGQRARVGGHDWAERRLLQQVQARDRDFVLLRQARREIETVLFDVPAAYRFVEELPRRAIRLRSLPCISPFAESWTQMAYSPGEVLGDPTEALERLHAALMGQSHAG